jgi:hypothetical protein
MLLHVRDEHFSPAVKVGVSSSIVGDFIVAFGKKGR